MNEKLSIDSASNKMIDKAEKENIELVWDRLKKMMPQCGFGTLGICCSICNMGPCSIDPFSDEKSKGVCGADADLIVARNLARKVAAGSAAHSDHGREIALALLEMAEDKTIDFKISDEEKTRKLASEFGIKTEKVDLKSITKALAVKMLSEFGKYEGNLTMANRAPAHQKEVWKRLDIMPRSIDREIVEILHRTNMGVDSNYKSVLLSAMRTALSDGWGGSMIATELTDSIVGSPAPVRAKVNLGVLKKEMVNIVVHGHEPLLTEAVYQEMKNPELISEAKAAGAQGINVAGICCTANEVLMRHGIPVAGNFLQQELALLTGAVEVMMVDVQCVMPSLSDIAGCFHTEIITTSHKAKFPDIVKHIEFQPSKAKAVAREIIRRAINNFNKREKSRVFIPDETMDLVAGFTTENVKYLLGGTFRGSYRPLNEAIVSGRIKGIAGVVGCNNPKVVHDFEHVSLVKELIKNDILVIQTGCSAIACAKAGLLRPEASIESAGPGLREVCEATGLPPVLHFGSCVDNSRILTAAVELINEGKIGKSFDELPVAGAAPECWMSEKAVAIGCYFVASGVYTVMGMPFPILGSKNVENFLCSEIESLTGGKFAFEPDPLKAAAMIIAHINNKRKKLGLKS
ncbi:MAG: anaerobic carbon-monoxide dehydrogenase catalytic subunit [Elusimicrobia bacterium]|nr:anaerobic carbon-monoxide dehydrogenase catalytic subunit [Candidatus Liberimonas magnetica]